MQLNELPLLELFIRLRRADLPLGFDEYKLLIESLQTGFGIKDLDSLKRLCCTLWVKSSKEKDIFDRIFRQTILEYSFLLDNLNKQEQDNKISKESASLEEMYKQDKEKLPVRKDIIILGSSILLGLSSLLTGNYILSKRIINFPPFIISRPVRSAEVGQNYEYSVIGFDFNYNDKLSLSLVTSPNWLEIFPDANNRTAMLRGVAPDNNFYIVEIVVSDGVYSNSQIFPINSNSSPTVLSIWFLLIAISLPCISYFPIQIFLDRGNKNTSDKNDKSPVGNDDKPPLQASPETQKIQEMKSIKLTGAKHLNLKRKIKPPKNLFATSYMDATSYGFSRRQMKQSWRYLRRLVRQGSFLEVDVDATISKIAREGTFLRPVLVPRKVNKTSLLLLLDWDGSMIPFHYLSTMLADTALRGGRVELTNIYYFRNCPDKYLYHDPNHVNAETLTNVISNLNSQNSTILIVSDAGAVRGCFNEERLRVTRKFLNMAKRYVRYIAWLNPMPRSRWEGTTAEEIAQDVKMFELNRQGLDNAIRILLGKHS
ncbi:MAG: hypothetical protein F6J95_020745 [Leptolyngbya sp. SIO1E4]|nr:hypothetical protein [Leptolyngbya sp. SIO1E4]